MAIIHNVEIVNSDGYKSKTQVLDEFGQGIKIKEWEPCLECEQDRRIEWKMRTSTTIDVIKVIKNNWPNEQLTSEADESFRAIMSAFRDQGEIEYIEIERRDWTFLFGYEDTKGILYEEIANPKFDPKNDKHGIKKTIGYGRFLFGVNLGTTIDQIKGARVAQTEEIVELMREVGLDPPDKKAN
jgi:hypothetical protein